MSLGLKRKVAKIKSKKSIKNKSKKPIVTKNTKRLGTKKRSYKTKKSKSKSKKPLRKKHSSKNKKSMRGGAIRYPAEYYGKNSGRYGASNHKGSSQPYTDLKLSPL